MKNTNFMLPFIIFEKLPFKEYLLHYLGEIRNKKASFSLISNEAFHNLKKELLSTLGRFIF